VPPIERIADEIEIDAPEVLRRQDSQLELSAETRDQLKQLGYAEWQFLGWSR
jgi:hypothetical protein